MDLAPIKTWHPTRPGLVRAAVFTDKSQVKRALRSVCQFGLVIALAVLISEPARAQWLSNIGDDIGWMIGEVKTHSIKHAIGHWDWVVGNSCGDVTPKTLTSIRGHNTCPNAAPSDIDDFVEAAFFNSGALIQMHDDKCQIARYTNFSSSSPAAKEAIHSFTEDVKTKLPDLRKRYKEIQDLGHRMANHSANALIQRGDGPVAPQMAEEYLRQTRAGWDELYKKDARFQ